ncbi:MAG TPA: dihydrofolate reductase [Bacteroidia bacterium]|nr:dihydrofolate reductase [Bacteroidia bacterium]HNT80694.1 dihydrofolate reductase [Bacteroidia bacterium]
MKVCIIAAVSENNVIGNENKLPWRLSSDLMLFKKLTMGNTVVMGRKTYESIGKALPGRRNIVLSRNPKLKIKGCEVMPSLFETYKACASDDFVFIIGGAEIYTQAIKDADLLYLTRVHTTLEGDAFFPEIRTIDWMTVKLVNFRADEKNEFDFTFCELQRVR